MAESSFSAFSVQPASSADAPLLRDVMLRCWTGTVAADSSAYRETPEMIAHDVARGGAALLWDGDTAIGCGRFVPVPGPAGEPDWVEIKRVGVLHACRGHNLGPVIVAALESQAEARGFPGAQLGVRADQPRLTAFWERLGYTIATDVTLSNPNPLTATPVFMRKRF